MVRKIITNKYDKAIIILLASLAFGNLYIGFGALQYSRILAIVFVPMLLNIIAKCNFVKSLLYFALFVIIYGFVSLTWTPNPIRGIEELLYYIIHFLLFFEILMFSKYANNALKSISKGWILSLSITLLIALWEITTGNHLQSSVSFADKYNLGGGNFIFRRYAAVTFYNYNSYVTFICVSIPFVFYSILNKVSKINYIYMYVIILLSLVVVLFNASRGGLLCLLVVFFLYFFNAPNKKYVIPVFLILLFAALAYFGDDMLALISYRGSDGGLVKDEGRMQIYSNGLKVFFDTKGFGTGLGGLDLWMNKFSNDILVTHCMPLEILVQFGFIIFVMFVTFLIRLFLKTLRIKDFPRRIALYMVFLSLPILSVIDSRYLLNACFFAYISSIIIFVNYEQIRPVSKNI